MTIDKHGVSDQLGAGGAGLAPGSGITSIQEHLRAAFDRIGAYVADEAALAAITAKYRTDKQIVLVGTQLWYRNDASAAAASAGTVVVSDDSATGRWLVLGALAASAITVLDTDGRLTAGNVETALAELAARIAQQPADLTALKAISATARADGMVAVLASDGSTWRFVAASAVTGDDILVATPAAGTGRWLRVDKMVDIKIAITKDTANNAVLYTVPTGFKLKPIDPFWEPLTNWTGGTDSAIGLSSSNAAASTAGDLLGGAAGDLAAGMLAASVYTGTPGTKIATVTPGLVLVAGDTIKFNRIASAFTAGTGYAHIPVAVVN
jgi:hypothetical protein